MIDRIDDPTRPLTWDPPGPGAWTLAADHYPRPITAAHRPFPEIWSLATTEAMRSLGLPLEARMATVNGLPYVSFATGGRQSSKPPPAWVMRLALRVVPSMRRTERQLARTLAERPWVEAARRWFDHGRPTAIARMLERTAIEPAELPDGDLAEHVDRCHHEALEAAREHLLLHAHDEPPTAIFAARMADWGIDPDDALALLAGSSPISAGASPELDALRHAVAGRSASTLAGLRSLDAEVAGALDRFLEHHGWRMVDGYDIDGPCLVEVPSLVVALATAPPPPDRSGELEAAVAAVRRAVPAEHREELGRWLADVRVAYGLRDDNGGILVSWPMGLLRRAMVAAGTRLADRGELDDPSLAIEADPAVLAGAVRGVAPLDEADLAARAAFRASIHAADAPRALGPPEPPLPTDLPGAFGLIMRAFALELPAETEQQPLHGLGIGGAPYTGRARLVLGAGRGIDDFEPGEVLIAPMTSPSYNVVLSLAGALVTEEGGRLSHAAIMARELGLPAVIGAPGATTEIRDGDLVTVDPSRGTVHRVAGGTPAPTSDLPSPRA